MPLQDLVLCYCKTTILRYKWVPGAGCPYPSEGPHGGGPVNDSIHLHDHLLACARRLLDTGRNREARQALRCLLRQSEVQTQTRADAQYLLGEMELAAGRYRQARRHFAAAIGLRPYRPEAYVRYAEAVEADPDGHLRKGCAALKRAICIDPQEPAYPTILGRLAARMGDDKLAG